MNKLYVVQRRTWFNSYCAYDDSDCIEGGGVAVAAFPDRKQAQAHARTLEKEAFGQMSSIFRLVNSEYIECDMDEEEFCAALRELGLDPPELVKFRYGTTRHWGEWYDEIADTLTPAQVKGIRKLFSKIKVYEVVEVELKD